VTAPPVAGLRARLRRRLGQIRNCAWQFAESDIWREFKMPVSITNPHAVGVLIQPLVNDNCRHRVGFARMPDPFSSGMRLLGGLT